MKRRRRTAGVVQLLALYRDVVLSSQSVHMIAKLRCYRPRLVRDVRAVLVH